MVKGLNAFGCMLHKQTFTAAYVLPMVRTVITDGISDR